jgi:opacity protein-like surface antigen
MKQLFAILTTLIIQSTAFGQHNIGIKVNGGLSYLDTKQGASDVTTDKIYFMPSGQGGLFYNFHLHEKFLIGAELLFTQIEGKEYFEIPHTDNVGNPLPTGIVNSYNIWRHISYFGIPIYFGLDVRKLNINLGFQSNFRLASSGFEKVHAPDVAGEDMSEDYKVKNINIDDYDYGVRIGLLFKLTDKFSMETNYYNGINDIKKKYMGNSKWKVLQMTVGLRYKFISIGGQKNKKENK